MEQMLKDNLLNVLKEWESVYYSNTKVWELMREVGFEIESPVANAIWKTFDTYTHFIENVYATDYLSWYCWDNDMGKKGLLVVDSNGEREIKNINDLYDAILGVL